MMKKTVIGVMGGSQADRETISEAYALGKKIAEKGWVLLNGGRNKGVMEASAKGASNAGGLTLGVLPGETDDGMSEYIQIPVFTGMGDARNVINVLSSDIVVVLNGGLGTVSEIVLALKNNKKTILQNFSAKLPDRLLEPYIQSGLLRTTQSPDETIRQIETLLLISA